MTPEEATPYAELLVHAYLETAGFSRDFLEEYGQPPTMLTKVHFLRSVAQASVAQDDRFILGEPWAEFGRVLIEERDTKRRCVLRSDSAVQIESSKRENTLFDSSRYLRSEVELLVYNFHRDGLDLAIAGTRQEISRTRLEATGPPTYIGTWPFVSDDPGPFNQRDADAFNDVGKIDLGEEEEGSG